MWQGTKDDAVHPESARYLAKLVPGAKLTIIDGASHDEVPRQHWPSILRAIIAEAKRAP